MSVFLRPYKLLLIAALMFASFSRLSAQTWDPLGSDEFNKGTYDSSGSTAINFDTANHPIVAFTGHIQEHKLSVRRYVNGQWSYMGSPGISGGVARETALEVDTLNNIYVGYVDYSPGTKVCVKKYDGANWVSVGAPVIATAVKSFAMDLSDDGVLYIAYYDSLSQTIRTKKFDGMNWVNVGNNTVATDPTNDCRIRVRSATEIYVGLTTWPGYFHLLKWNGSTWNNFITPMYVSMSIGNWLEFDNNNQLHVMIGRKLYKLVAAGLQLVTTNPNTEPWGVADRESQITFDANNHAWVALNNGHNILTGWVYKWDGTTWTPPFIKVHNMFNVYNMCIKADRNGVPHFFFSDFDHIGITHRGGVVGRFNGQNFELLGDRGIHRGYNYTPCLTLDTAKTPYLMVHTDTHRVLNYSPRFAVNKWVNNAWVPVGQPIFPPAGTPHMTIGSDNVPYIGSADPTHSHKASVLKFDGANWNYLGNPGFSDYISPSVQIVVMKGNKVVVSYYQAPLYQVMFKMYNGSNWADLGSTPNMPETHFMSTDSAGNILVAYEVLDTTFIRKYDGSSWSTYTYVTHGVDELSGFVTDKNSNNLYTLEEAYPNNQLIVRKFDGAVWMQLGGVVDSFDGYQYPQMVVDEYGFPYIAYLDWDGVQHVAVKRYNGTAWVSAGSASARGATEISLAAGGGKVYAAYITPQVYVRGMVAPNPAGVNADYHLKAANQGSRNKITWGIEGGEPGDVLTLERSFDGSSFHVLETGLSTERSSSHTYWDRAPQNGINHYRLKLTAPGGAHSYSNTAQAFVRSEDGLVFTIWPNPAEDAVYIETANSEKNASISVSDINGRVVRSIKVTSARTTIDVKGLPSGMYILQYKDEKHKQSAKLAIE